jgi:hypothetical protein
MRVIILMMGRRILCFCLFVALFWSCSDDEPEIGLSQYDQQVIEYFGEVALGFEFGGATEVTRKWVGDMKIFVGGEQKPALLNELQNIIEEINALATDGFNISIVTDSLDMNYYVYFGSGSNYASIYPSQSGLIAGNWGLFSVYWDAAEQIYKGNMYVDIDRANDLEERHLLREELAQSLGLAKDSDRYNDSIFQIDWTTTTEFSDIDKDLIRLLYHPQMQAGLNATQVEETLTQIILGEK